jgi:quercetin dioxygenase-like cupin family protein
MRWLPAILVGLLVGTLAIRAMAQDPTKVGPEVYKSVFENERIRVNEITFKPAAKIAMHQHPDHVVYWLSGGTLRIFSPDGKHMDVTAKAGEVVWLPATTHSAENIGATEIRAVQVELKEPAPAKSEAK